MSKAVHLLLRRRLNQVSLVSRKPLTICQWAKSSLGRLFNWILGITEIPFVGVERWPDHRNLSPEEQLWSPEEKKNHWEKKKTKKQKKAQQMDLKKSSGQEDLDQVNLEKALVKFEEKKKQQEAQQMGLKKALRQEELEKLEENKKYKEVQQMGLEKVWWHVTLDMETKELLEEASEKLAKKTEP